MSPDLAGHDPAGPNLGDIDLVIFDKDGTLIAFDAMWGGWARELGADLETTIGRPFMGELFEMLGYDPQTGRVAPHGGLAATPMTRLRERTRELLIATGSGESAADEALEATWRAPDPVTLAHPLGDLGELLERLRKAGKRIAIATTDDRRPTERTLAALGIASAVDSIVCADDGMAVKPAPDMVLHLCSTLDVEPRRTAVVGDAVADLEMARAAGAGLVIGVLTGVAGATDLASLADRVIASVDELGNL